MRIVVVDDEATDRNFFTKVLQSARHEVFTFGDAIEALNYFQSKPPIDVMLIDYALGGGPNGIALARQARSLFEQCVIFIISHVAEKEQIIEAFRAKVDDVLLKPVAPRDLLEQIDEHVLARRVAHPRQEGTIRSGDLTVNLSACTVHRADQEIHLTNTEFSILVELLTRAGRLVLYPELYGLIKAEQAVDPRMARNWCKTHVGNLRQKLNHHGSPDPIGTVRGRGFRWIG